MSLCVFFRVLLLVGFVDFLRVWFSPAFVPRLLLMWLFYRLSIVDTQYPCCISENLRNASSILTVGAVSEVVVRCWQL